jgi:ABC-2 type transport system ATP-binding protein
MDQAAIDLRSVTKRYGRVQALDDVAMQVQPGEVFGLLGPNGAGKSTLVKILMTVIRPTHAEGTLLGHPIGHKRTLARVGYLPEHLRMPDYLTGRQAIEFFGAMSKIDRPTRRRRAGELLELVGMRADADRRLGTYSKGMRQRIGLAQALVNEPELLVLDEPTDGLDPVGHRDVREILQRLRGQRKTIFLNSHRLEEVERICDRVAILVRGRIVRQGTVPELTAGSEFYEIDVLPGEFDLREALGSCMFAHRAGETASAPARLTGWLASGETVELVGSTVRIVTGDAARVQPVLDVLRARGVTILAVRPLRQTLEEFFMSAVTAEPEPALAILVPEGAPS